MANRCEWEWAAYAWDRSIDDGQRISRLQSAATGPMLVRARVIDRNTTNSGVYGQTMIPQMRKYPVSGKFCVEKCLLLMSRVRLRRLVGDRGKVNQVSWCLLPGSLKAGVKLLLLQQLRLVVLVKRFLSYEVSASWFLLRHLNRELQDLMLVPLVPTHYHYYYY